MRLTVTPRRSKSIVAVWPCVTAPFWKFSTASVWEPASSRPFSVTLYRVAVTWPFPASWNRNTALVSVSATWTSVMPAPRATLLSSSATPASWAVRPLTTPRPVTDICGVCAAGVWVGAARRWSSVCPWNEAPPVAALISVCRALNRSVRAARSSADMSTLAAWLARLLSSRICSSDLSSVSPAAWASVAAVCALRAVSTACIASGDSSRRPVRSTLSAGAALLNCCENCWNCSAFLRPPRREMVCRMFVRLLFTAPGMAISLRPR